VTSLTGIRSAWERSSKIPAPGTVQSAVRAGTGGSGTARGATDAPTVSRYPVMVAEAGSETHGFDAGIIGTDIREYCGIGFAHPTLLTTYRYYL